MRKHRLRTVVALAAAVLAAATGARSQPDPEGRSDDPRPAVRAGMLFVEPVEFPVDSTPNARLDVLYRVDQSFFVATRDGDRSQSAEPLSREGEMVLEVADDRGVTLARQIRRFFAGAAPADSLAPSSFFSGVASFRIPRGPFSIVTELTDLRSTRRFVDRQPGPRPPPIADIRRFSSPVFVEWSSTTPRPDTLQPLNYGGNLLFGRQAALWALLDAPPTQGTGSLAFTFSIIELNRQDSAFRIRDTTVIPVMFRRPAPEAHTVDQRVVYTFPASGADSLTSLLVPIPSEQLPLRRFRLIGRLTMGDRTFPLVRTFAMVWPDMPLSLRNVDSAIEALRPITTEALRDSLLEGEFEEQRDKLEAWWARRDPTPGTAYNEVMTQYYRRVDHALRSFATLRSPDGTRTDRGRIYIRYGPPTRAERTLDPVQGFRERWIYEGSKREFIFRDERRSGDYELVEGGGR